MMKRLCRTKYPFYGLGILILTFGVSLTIKSDLGASPLDALLVGLSQSVGLTVGSWEIIIALLFIVCNSVLQRKVPELLGLLTAFITGIGIDVWLFLLEHLSEPAHLLSKLIYSGAGLIAIGFGTAIYLHTNFAPIPIDRFMLVLQELTGMSMLAARTGIYLFFLLMALLVDGPIGVGTLLTVGLGGPILGFFMPLAGKVLSRLVIHRSSIFMDHADRRHSL